MMKLPDLVQREITSTQHLTTGAASDLFLAVFPFHLRGRRADALMQARGRFNLRNHMAVQQVFELDPHMFELFIVAFSTREPGLRR